MASFNGNIGTPSNGFNAKVEYGYSQDIANNKTTITNITGHVKRNNSTYYPYNSTKSATIKIEYLKENKEGDKEEWVVAKTLSDTSSYNLNTDKYVKFISGSNIVIPHKSDGTQKVRITFTVDGKLSNWYPKGSISKTIPLTTIQRASEPSLSVSSIEMGKSVTINTNRASDSFTHTLEYSFGNISETIASDVGESTTFTPSIDLANQIPNAISGTCIITCKTYNENTLIGTKTVNLKLEVPSSVVPSISSFSLSEANTDIPSSWGCYVQNKSKLKVVTTATGSYGSTIQSYKITGIDGNIYTSSDFTSNTLTTSGTKNVTVTVTDSRGRTATATETYNCVEYANPQITNSSVTRCNSDGTDNEEGTYLKYTFKGSVSSVNNKNSYVYKIGYKLASASSYTYVTIENDSYSIDKQNAVLSDVILSANNSYDIQFFISDYFTSSAVVQSLGTGFTLMDFNSSGKSMAIGKVSEASGDEKKFEIAMDALEVNGVDWIQLMSRFMGMNLHNVDANDYTKSGIYYFSTECFNVPDAYIYVLCLQANDNNAVQLGITISSQKVYFRTNNNGNWNDWICLNKA